MQAIRLTKFHNINKCIHLHIDTSYRSIFLFHTKGSEYRLNIHVALQTETESLKTARTYQDSG
jgi:hypothetical protein